MRATTFFAPAKKINGAVGRVYIGFDAIGPVMWFVDANGNEDVFTGDDAAMWKEFMFCDDRDLDARWDALHQGEWVFEAGADVQYEGLYHRKFFKDFSKAEEYAQSVADEWSEPVVYAERIES